MLLRRFMKHTTEQNWYAVVLDIIVVIVGIFLGIQVTNWQQHLNDKDTAKQYLQRFDNDLQADIKHMSVRLEFWNQVMDYTEVSLDYLEHNTPEENESWKYLLALFQSSQVSPLLVNDITYKEIQQVGQLALITNLELRSALAKYYSFNSSVASDSIIRHLPPYRAYVRGKISSEVVNHIWNNCFDVRSLEGQELIDCESPISAQQINHMLTQIKSDPKVLEHLLFWYSTQKSALQFLPHNIEQTKMLQQKVQAEHESL